MALDAKRVADILRHKLSRGYNNTQRFWFAVLEEIFEAVDEEIAASGGGAETDELVGVSGNDTAPGYLLQKLVAGARITLNEIGDGGDEDLEIVADVQTDPTVAVSANDAAPGFLSQKMAAGARITINELNDGADEDLEIVADVQTDPTVQVSPDDTTPATLEDKIVAGTNISLATLSPGGDEDLQINAADPTVAVSGNDTAPGPLEDKVLNAGVVVFQTRFEGANEDFEIAVHPVRESFTVLDAGQTDYELSLVPIESTQEIYLNGQRLRPGPSNDYTISGALVSMLKSLFVDDSIAAAYYATEAMAAFQYGLLQIRADIEPDILLDTNQSTGSTIPDISGNGYDFTADGVENTDFFWEPGRSVYPYHPTRLLLNAGATRVGVAAFSGANGHSIIVPIRGPLISTTRYVLDVSSDRFAYTSGAGIGIFDTGARYLDYQGGNESEFIVGATHLPADKVSYYINGLHVADVTPVAGVVDIVPGATWTLGQRYTGAGAVGFRFDGFFLYKNGEITAEQHYNSWLRSTRLEHHYKTHIEGTSLETGLTQYLPTWETSGADIMDVAGSQNHGSQAGSVVLNTPAAEIGFRKSFRYGSAGSMDVDTGINLQVDSFSVAFVWSDTVTLGRAIYSLGDASNAVILAAVSGFARVYIRGGGVDVTSPGGAVAIKESERFVLTFDRSSLLCKLYQDGVETISIDFSTLTFGDTSLLGERLNSAPGFSGGFSKITGFMKWSRVLTPAEAAEVWAEPVIGSSFPAPTTKYVATDLSGSTIPDSSGNGNGAATLESNGALPTLSGGSITLDNAIGQWIAVEAGIAAAAAASGKYTVAIAAYLEDPDAVWAINNSGGGNRQLLFLTPGSARWYYDGVTALSFDTVDYDRTPASIVISSDEIENESTIVINGLLVYRSPGTINPTFASDFWSIGQEYDGSPTPSNFSTMDFFEAQLFDSALDTEQCIDLSRTLFNGYFR